LADENGKRHRSALGFHAKAASARSFSSVMLHWQTKSEISSSALASGRAILVGVHEWRQCHHPTQRSAKRTWLWVAVKFSFYDSHSHTQPTLVAIINPDSKEIHGSDVRWWYMQCLWMLVLALAALMG